MMLPELQDVGEAYITVTFPDGADRSYPKGTTVGEILRDWGKVPSEELLAARVGGRLVDLSAGLSEDAVVEPLTFGDLEGKEIYWHSSAHILAQAVQQLLPEAKLGIGPAIREGFYYDFDMPEPFSDEDLGRIEERMFQIIRQDIPFRREEVPRPEAIRIMSERDERYKVELLEEDIEEETVSLYRQGEFVDLCRGPHVPSTGYIKAVKLLSVAGAYWRGDERRPMLQRIYGISFPSEEDLEAFLRRREEIERRDHRRLGKQLDLFSIQEDGGPGLVYWHPKGARVRTIIEDFWRTEHYKRGYELVYTPHIAKVELWERSGHMAWFRESMFSPMEVEDQAYLLKPMNCPFHILMYKSKTRSY
ncbi:MAG TPA: TGS domain-containing protein, partial [Candidatus Latescibacteria bacterium]|nr:TGS domain-containing protein [Candidatus Latescibacterota bacterium]